MIEIDATIPLEASQLVRGDRQDAYEGTTEKICALWGAYLGQPVSPEDYYTLMALMKVGRATGPYRRDSYVDGCGYLTLAEREARGRAE